MSDLGNLQDLLGEGRRVRDEIEVLEGTLSELKKTKDRIDDQIMELMQEQGIQRTGTDIANVSITNREIASVKDWDAFNQFVYENQAFHLYQRRITNNAALEYAAVGEAVPGVEITKIPVLNFRRN